MSELSFSTRFLNRFAPSFSVGVARPVTRRPKRLAFFFRRKSILKTLRSDVRRPLRSGLFGQRQRQRSRNGKLMKMTALHQPLRPSGDEGLPTCPQNRRLLPRQLLVPKLHISLSEPTPRPSLVLHHSSRRTTIRWTLTNLPTRTPLPEARGFPSILRWKSLRIQQRSDPRYPTPHCQRCRRTNRSQILLKSATPKR